MTHGAPADSFWSVFANGVEAAASDLASRGVTIDYSAPPVFDMDAMSELIDAAVAKAPQGLVVSIPDATALGPAIQSAVAAGFPVVSANSGSDIYKSLGILTHVGQDEYLAGKGAGATMAAIGVTNAICINQEVGNAAEDARCAGFAEGLGSAASSLVVPVNLNDQTGTVDAIRTALADPGIGGVMALGPDGAVAALRALDQLGRTGQVRVATFDLSPDVLAGIRAGTVDFAIDQQQFLQGYLPVENLTYYDLYGLLPGGGAPILTGPGFVTLDNVDAVAANMGTAR